MSGRPGLRPRRVGEILDAAIKVYTSNARTLIGLTATVVVPFEAISALVLLSTVSSSSQVPRSTEFGLLGHARAHTALGAHIVLFVTSFLVATLTIAACVKAVSDIYLEQPTGVAVSLRFALCEIVSIIWLELVYGVLILIAFALLVIPGIWLYAAWSVAMPVLLIERTGGWSALGRSMRLVQGRWWATAATLLVAELAALLVGTVIDGLILGVLLSGSSIVFTVLLVTISSAIAAILTRPFSASLVTVLYYDLRVRHEGYDVAVLADEVGLSMSPYSAGAGFTGTPIGPPRSWPPPGGGPSPSAAADGERE